MDIDLVRPEMDDVEKSRFPTDSMKEYHGQRVEGPVAATANVWRRQRNLMGQYIANGSILGSSIHFKPDIICKHCFHGKPLAFQHKNPIEDEPGYPEPSNSTDDTQIWPQIREGEDNRNDEDDGGVRRIVLADTADKSAHKKHWSSFRRPDSLDNFSSSYQAAADYLRKYPRSVCISTGQDCTWYCGFTVLRAVPAGGVLCDTHTPNAHLAHATHISVSPSCLNYPSFFAVKVQRDIQGTCVCLAQRGYAIAGDECACSAKEAFPMFLGRGSEGDERGIGRWS
ncbi:hypothetical protein B0H13DRAFT_2260487 [Mycena leptocephala]|nr:hypothetical protein B0H13DRAFT_2260487 [Mycena leptocephala]